MPKGQGLGGGGGANLAQGQFQSGRFKRRGKHDADIWILATPISKFRPWMSKSDFHIEKFDVEYTFGIEGLNFD